MSSRKHKNKPTMARDAPKQQRNFAAGWLCSTDAWTTLCQSGYKPLTSCPEVQMCIGVYADLIANMTIMQMKNTDKGDVRVHDGLSRKLDIEPHRLMTHQTWMSNIVRVLLSEGNQVTVPTYTPDGLLDELIPLPPGVSFLPDRDGYRIRWNGKEFRPDEVLHFPLNPDPDEPWKGAGYSVALKDVVKSIRQATDTKNALMENPAPSLIVKVDGLIAELQSPEGHEKLRDQYLGSMESGKPWMIPAETMQLEQIKPLTLNDLAIKTNLELDKRSIAAIFGVPPFLVGIGSFNETEFNWFVATRVMAIARIIEQELTRKLLIAPDRYFRLNNRSLLNYNISQIVTAGSEMVDRIAMRRNEWRDWMGLPPDPEMDELLALENYIPATMVGKQNKLAGGENDEQTA